ncbi:hypothetical protein REPUB_Repub06bG0105000 [Reevesia pubescens]
MASASLTLLSALFPNPSKSSLKHRISNTNYISMQENLNLVNIDSKEGIRLRREIFIKGLAMLPLVVLGGAPISEAREVEVGSYLPLSPTDPSFVVFKASPKDTPALRAGNVQPYQFLIPPTWKQSRVANILSGNYCQPKCAEPWVEVKFEDEKQGKVQVVASPLIRLTNKPNASIEEIGSPEKVIASLGPFVTGNSYDPDELLDTSVEKRGEQTVCTCNYNHSFCLILLLIVATTITFTTSNLCINVRLARKHMEEFQKKKKKKGKRKYVWNQINSSFMFK